MNKRDRELYQVKAEILKAISHSVRLAIIDFLKDGEKSVNDIAKWVGGSQSNISKHLSVLKRIGIVGDRKEGLNRFYYLKIFCVTDFSSCVNETLKKKIEYDRKLVYK